MEYLTERQAIRQAMLKKQSEWLEEADKAETFTQIAIAKVIAEAFGQAAAEYAEPKTREGWANDDDTGDDELGATHSFLAQG